MTGTNALTDSRNTTASPIAKFGVAVVFSAVTICVITIFFLVNTVREEIDALAAANSDTTQWSLAQAEVDMLALQVAVLAAAAGEVTGLQDVRRSFDIFYSRVRTVAESRQFAELRTKPEAQLELAKITGFLDKHVASFDADDPVLLEALPRIEVDLSQLRRDVRSFSLHGVALFASAADERRESIASLLTTVGLLTFALVIALVLMLGVVLGMFRRSAQSEKELAASRNRLQNVISTSIDAILVVAQNGRIIDYNGAAQRIFGHKRSEVLGMDMAEVIVPDHLRGAHDAGMARYRETGEKRVVGTGLLRLEAKRQDGTTFPADIVISSVETDGNEVFVSYIRDVSAQVAAEQELVETRDKAVAGEKAKADLLAVMSHEMRTPLNGLIGTLELLDGTPISTDQRKYLNAMQTSANLLLHHVNDVLNISRADAGQLDLVISGVNPADLLTDLVESQRRAVELNGNAISCSIASSVPQIWTDRIRLNQVVLNLVGNANKFTRSGKILVEVDTLGDGRMVEFRVIDDGIGIAEEHRASIFEDFRTIDASYGRIAEGTGLGLGISKRLVEAMGGEIGVESEPGEGSLFWFRLPVGVPDIESDRAAQAPAAKATVTVEPKGLNILLVEDNEINRLVAREMLKTAGHRVTEAHDGQEGLTCAGQFKFDIILMDISMPELDGVAATEIIRTEPGPNQHTPIIALTAHALPDDVARFREAGMDEILVKPLTQQSLHFVLRSQRAQPEGEENPRAAAILSDLVNQLGHEQTLDLMMRLVDEIDALSVLLEAPIDCIDTSAKTADDVHKSAGSASVFGQMDLVTQLKFLETILREKRTEKLPEAILAFRTSWSRARSALEEQRRKMSL